MECVSQHYFFIFLCTFAIFEENFCTDDVADRVHNFNASRGQRIIDFQGENFAFPERIYWF